MSLLNIDGLLGKYVERVETKTRGEVVGGFIENHGLTLIVRAWDEIGGDDKIYHWKYDRVVLR